MPRFLLTIIVCFACFGTAFAQEQEAGSDTAAATGEQPAIDVFSDIGASSVPKDVILVLDNSGSMKKNDPNFLTSQAVTEFISGLDTSTRIGIIIFDQNVNLEVPLTPISMESREKVLASLKKINYRGLFTDSPSAIERAIYELKNNNRSEAQKMIIFMTDGIVDTGKPEADLERSKWLRDSLAADAADNGIKIFGIAFTEQADFQLIQSLSQKTKGEYYRVLQAEDLHKVFAQINENINKPPEPEPAPQAAVTPLEPPKPVIIEVPVPTAKVISKEERLRSIIIIVAIVVLIGTVLALLVILVRRSRATGHEVVEADTEAFLNDIHGYTKQASYKMGTRATMIGRVAGKDTDQLDYIVIPESTIGRRHCLIEYKDFAYWIVDQGSINGTFVNDQPVTSEVRLKHGDKVRLHKYEFEFVMPEMVDAGMTVVSQTVLAGQGGGGGVAIAAAASSMEATELKGSAAEQEADDEEPEFDITGTSPGEALDFEITGTRSGQGEFSEEETLARGNAVAEPEPDFELEMEPEDEDEPDSEEATQIRDDIPRPSPAEKGTDVEDETLMPGESDFDDADATIRKEDTDEDISMEHFIDINDEDEDK